MRLALIAGISVFGAWLGLVPRPATACSPAPNHFVQIVEDDSPECAVIEVSASYVAGGLFVNNQCAEPFTFEVEDCPACEEPITVQPGEESLMVIEDREQASSVALAWSVGDMSGQLRADVDWKDNSGACDGNACRVGGTGGAPLGLLCAALVVLSGFARRPR